MIVRGYPIFCVNVKIRCTRRRAGYPVRRLDCHEAEILQPVKDSCAAAVHMPLTDKGFLLHGHLGTVMGNGYDNATMPRFTYGYGANGQAASPSNGT